MRLNLLSGNCLWLISVRVKSIWTRHNIWSTFSPSWISPCLLYFLYIFSSLDLIKHQVFFSSSVTDCIREGELDAMVFQLSLCITWCHITKEEKRGVCMGLYSKSLEHSMCSALKYWWVSKNTLRPVTFRNTEANGSHKEEGWCHLSIFSILLLRLLFSLAVAILTVSQGDSLL